ncbi:hypothetical protein [Paractinoplanes toevensis]|uniref:Uncharacterized protein n=1 Tax=Paractinoplanes toevensis TaxID=571911 RepID=A0A919T9V8_9ACTN|nr:hypothetical protein [Actinoplanes toevensis]GIM91733.1 hypothetical protein Ato02nite_035260 [Actinoplanes toevensis]
MTAPGNSALLLTLLAVFVACCGYAAGRIHQRRQTEDDREEAYRDGYETGTRSVFSVAARMIAPRRAARASAQVTPAVDMPAPAEPSAAAPGLPADSRSVAGLSASGSPVAGSPVGGLSASGSPVTGLSVAGSAVGGLSASESVRDLPGAGDSAGRLAPPEPIASCAQFPADPRDVGGQPALLRRAGVPGAQPPAQPIPIPPVPAPAIPASRMPMASETDETSLGFPVPPAPSPRVIAEPAAVGGVVYRPFPDPRAPLDAVLPSDEGTHHPIPAAFGPSRMPRSAPIPSSNAPDPTAPTSSGTVAGPAAAVPSERVSSTPASAAPIVSAGAFGRHSPPAPAAAGSMSGPEDDAADLGFSEPGASSTVRPGADRSVHDHRSTRMRRSSWAFATGSEADQPEPAGGVDEPAPRRSRVASHAAKTGAVRPTGGTPSADAVATPPPFLGMPGPASGMPDAFAGPPDTAGLPGAAGVHGAERGPGAAGVHGAERGPGAAGVHGAERGPGVAGVHGTGGVPDGAGEDVGMLVESSTESTGRHTVPDELVQATTYRLPADRIFRAKVPEPVALPEEPTTRLGVPKPRQS